MIGDDKLLHHVIASPVSNIRITGNHEYITEISFAGKSALSKKKKADLPEPLRECTGFFEEYFNSRDIPGPAYMQRYLYLDDFSEAGRLILITLMSVSAGSVISYGDLARKAGIAGAARFAGNMMARNPFAILVPCHRVITSAGDVGNYSGGVHIKEWLLAHEGIVIVRGKIKTS